MTDTQKLRNSLKSIPRNLLEYTTLLVGFVPLHSVRWLFYKHVLGMKINKTNIFHRRLYLFNPKGIRFGNNTVMGEGCILDGRGGLVVGNNVTIGRESWVWTLQHDYNDPHLKLVGKSTLIEDYVRIEGRVTILPGVKIGRGSVLASCALITKDVEPLSVVGGVPARKIAVREDNMRYIPAFHKFFH